LDKRRKQQKISFVAHFSKTKRVWVEFIGIISMIVKFYFSKRKAHRKRRSMGKD
jgi:hypothetical protein